MGNPTFSDDVPGCVPQQAMAELITSIDTQGSARQYVTYAPSTQYYPASPVPPLRSTNSQLCSFCRYIHLGWQANQHIYLKPAD